MASIFKRAGNSIWRVDYVETDPKTGRRFHRELSARTTIKAQAEAFAKKLESRARQNRDAADDRQALISRGVLDMTAEALGDHAGRPLAEHLDDFGTMQEARGNTDSHIEKTRRYIELAAEACGIAGIRDFDAAKLAGHIADLRRGGDGLGHVTLNNRLTAVKAFTRWLWKEGRLPADPLAGLAKLNARTDRRHRRRALADAELGRLLAMTATGPKRFGLAGPDRAMLYRMAAETGLRASEIACVIPARCALADLDAATITIPAAYSKHRREDEIPLRPGFAAMLRDYMAGRPADEPLFIMPARTADMLKADLTAAGIAYADAAGHVADFHSLRALFITRLARANIAPAVAMRLARHSSITLTIDHYTKLDIADGRAALAKLADIPEAPADHTSNHTNDHTNLGVFNRLQGAEAVTIERQADERKIA